METFSSLPFKNSKDLIFICFTVYSGYVDEEDLENVFRMALILVAVLFSVLFCL